MKPFVLPFKGNQPLTSGYGARTLRNGDSTFHAAVDWGGRFEVLPIGDGHVSWVKTGGRVDNPPTRQTPVNYVKVTHTVNGQVFHSFYYHLETINVRLGQRVTVDTILGMSGRTGYSFGTHLHLVLKRGETTVNPLDYIENTPRSDLSINASNMQTISIERGDGFSSIARRAGFAGWDNEPAAIEFLRSQDPTHPSLARGALWATDRPFNINAQAAPVAESESSKLKNTIAEMEAKLKEVEVAEKRAAELQAELEKSQIELHKAQAETERLERELAEANGSMGEYALLGSFDAHELQDVAVQAIEDTGAVDGLLNKWGLWVDKNVTNNTLKSILKYDVFVLLGSILSIPTLGLTLTEYGVPANAAVAVSFIAGILVKLLLTRYDTNKDGKLDKGDAKTLSGVLS